MNANGFANEMTKIGRAEEIPATNSLAIANAMAWCTQIRKHYGLKGKCPILTGQIQ